MKFNVGQLTIAREYRGITQQDLASAAGITQAALSKIESGLLQPSEGTLEKLAEVLCFPITFFQRDWGQAGILGGITYYRKRQRTSLKVLRQVQAKTTLLLQFIHDLLQSVDLEAPNKFVYLEPDNLDQGAAEAAWLVRSAWKLPAGPVANVTAAIESAGGIIIECAFLPNDIDALHISLSETAMPPVFFVNTNVPGDRLRWSLAHELGHAVLHSQVTENVEEEANIFAGEFLAPRDQISRSLERLTLSRAKDLKAIWKISIAALIMRASDVGAITAKQKSNLFAEMNYLGIRKKEPMALSRERPSLIHKLLRIHLYDLEYTTSDLCDLMCVRREDLAALLPTESTLRVV